MAFLSKFEVDMLSIQKEKSSNFNLYNLGECQWTAELWDLAIFDTKRKMFFEKVSKIG